jgi:putative membrane protein
MLSVAVTPRQALWSTWSFQLLPSIAAVGLLYSVGLARLWRSGGGRAAVGRREAAAFFAGLVAVAGALVSPIHHAGDQILSAHMVQHLLLILVAAPLLVVGRPKLPFLRALPRSWRRTIHRLGSTRALRRLERVVLSPAVIWVGAVAVLWSWHVPALFDAALRDEGLHTLEHLSFLGTAYLFWWVVLQPAGSRLAPGHDVLYVFTAGVASGALGALLTFAATPIYPAYAPRALALGVSPLSDQQLAGLVMWIPAGVVYLVFASWLFVRWLRVVEAGVAAMALAVLLAVTACASTPRRTPPPEVPGGSPVRGASALERFGCGSCHTIPGIRGADALVGPPLNDWSRRGYIAGELPNNAANLIRWIMDPQAVEPGTAMPNLGVSEEQARDIAAYLFALGR